MSQELLILTAIIVVAGAIFWAVFSKKTAKLQSKVDALTLLVKENDRQRESVKRELQELRSGTIGVGKRVLELEQKIAKQSDMIEEASQQDPQSKLYSRALKMVGLGAGVQELMEECELPKAEAELIIRLHKK
ncbi:MULTISPECIES: DUF2802 domain-containing protein [Shewanella]|uniref:DUF2802 domain-containing protein n=1 Tax=Shewanella TaxID=22 RepID=UPI0006D65A3E|nr:MULTISPECIES: DUF2802 domain-containing protein [Shewanella]KPZ69882.1 hypothetical protein AN944_02577 [Shewanella sp. P1-14-1]MBQ4891185.1 DUF2802 domain-containing protein [Shewanella sp. MMG014]OBT10314.1 DNA repair protein [Shewanella sp. UCD-FRSSP16_17]